MSQNEINDLIDEQELRDALRPLRAEREAFEAGVRSRIEAARAEATNRPPAENQLDRRVFEQSPWLQVAASVIPFSLLGKVAGGVAPIPLGKLSFGYKLIGYAALPATSLLLMVGATIFGIVQIGRAQRSPQVHGDQIQQQAVALMRWWKQFGVVSGCMLILFVALVFFGYVLPVFLVFLGSGIAMVSLVTRLGRAGMIDRRAIGANLVMGLMLLAQITQISTSTNFGVHLLDQALVQAVLYVAAVVLAILLCLTIRNRLLVVLGSVHAICFGMVFVGFFARSLWAPVTTDTLKNYVESFDEAPFHTASWQRWAVPAAWLQDSGTALDLAKPRRLLESEISGQQNYLVLGIAFDTNLIKPEDLMRLRDLERIKRQLANEQLRDVPVPSVQQVDYAIQAMAELGQLTPSDRDTLEARLQATLGEIEAGRFSTITEALITIKSLDFLERPCDDKTVRDLVHRVIVDFQRVRFQSGVRSGGFALSRTLDFSDDLTTAAAVELMQRYGVPAKLDVMALRSYLRPSMNDHRQILQSPVRVATRERLESISGLPPITWWDYVRYEQNLWMALMVVLLCVYATLSSPIRVMGATVSDEL